MFVFTFKIGQCYCVVALQCSNYGRGAITLSLWQCENLIIWVTDTQKVTYVHTDMLEVYVVKLLLYFGQSSVKAFRACAVSRLRRRLVCSSEGEASHD